MESAQDVLEELRIPAPLTQQALDLSADSNAPGHGPESQEGNAEPSLLRALGHDPVSLDALQARCGWSTAQLQGQLLELELAGQVGRLPGGLFQRIGSA